MKPVLTSMIFLFFLCPAISLACDGHTHVAKMNIWHTKALKPYLPLIAAGTVSPDSAFQAFAKILERNGAHLEEIYPVLQLKDIKHYDWKKFYKEKTGSLFMPDPRVTDCVTELEKIRSQQTYMSGCAEALQEYRIRLMGTVNDTVLRETLFAIIDVYEEDGSFWDLAAIDYNLEPKGKDAVRRDSWDLGHFSTYYPILRALGLDHVQAHAIASLETAYEAAICQLCGVW